MMEELESNFKTEIKAGIMAKWYVILSEDFKIIEHAICYQLPDPLTWEKHLSVFKEIDRQLHAESISPERKYVTDAYPGELGKHLINVQPKELMLDPGMLKSSMEDISIQQALNILERITRKEPTKKRQKRLEEFLKGPIAEGWFMRVPPCFNEALDIKLTERILKKKRSLVRTQGSSFSFKTGDILYATPYAYKDWPEALKSITLCVQVKEASSAIPSTKKIPRDPGLVTFSIIFVNKEQSKYVERGEHTMSQDEFVKFLIVGPPDDLKRKIEKIQKEE